MNFNSYRSKLITLIIILSLLLVALVFIFLKPPAPPVTDENNNCQQTNLPYQDPTLSTDQRVADLMNRMTVAEKIGTNGFG